ncbi:MAG: hypothetical protein HZB99_00215 [Candidatus Harrisonbacteria bacterium]|nr:hypothetical protein [Candidatus Harrisonbacteria bacterium]
MTLVIYLRDLTKNEAKFLVEVKKESDEEYLEDEQISEMFKEFVTKSKAKLPLKSKKVDIWIGMWINESQLTIKFPPEFMALVSQNGWPVTFDLND